MKRNVKIIIIVLLIGAIVIIGKIIKDKKEYNNFPKYKDLEKAKELNKDTVGWIYVPKTNINYPIMYREDDYYLDYGFEREKVTSGAIHAISLKKQNIVITGHNSRASITRFYWLHNIKDVNLGLTNSCYEKSKLSLSKEKMPNFENKEDRIWYISIYGITGKWEVWAMYETTIYEKAETVYYNIWDNSYNFNDKDQINEWINNQIERSQYKFGTIPDVNDQFLTIFTCGCKYYEYENEARLYFFLRKI